MDNNDLPVRFIIGFKKSPPDMSTCVCCEDVIYSTVNRMIITDSDKIEETDTTFCFSCHKELMDELEE